ncbi:MAG: GNAT family N-acetyltransferase [Patescibacteria group bacterium]
MILIGEKIKLRNLKKSDWESIFKHANNRKISKYTDIPHPFTILEIKKYIRKSTKEFKTKKSFHFGIDLLDNEEIIGVVSLTGLDWKNKSAELEFWLSPKYWSKGIASDSLITILLFAFKELKLNRIYSKVLPENIASIKFLKNNNFIYEGTLRKSLFERGKFNDIYIFSILRKEFKVK